MVQIVLIRPGSTEFDEQGRIQGTLDIPLSDQGKDQVCEAIEGLRPLAIATLYAAPCQSAAETAEKIGKAIGAKIKSCDELRNLDHGLWQGLLLEEVKRKQPKVFRQWQEEPESVCPPEGETVGEARERVEDLLGRLQRKHRDGVIGLVAAEPLASIVHCCMLHLGMNEVWKARSCCGSWEVLGIEGRVLSHRGVEVAVPLSATNGHSHPVPVPSLLQPKAG